MKPPAHRRHLYTAAASLALCLVPAAAHAQAAPASATTAKHVREASDAYLTGARQLRDNNPAAAQQSFARAAELDPTRNEYALALAVAREHFVTQLVQAGAKQRLLGNQAAADKLFAQAHELDPDNTIVAEHLDQPAPPLIDGPPAPVGAQELARLSGPVRLTPTPGTKSFHTRGDAQAVLRQVYNEFGIQVSFDALGEPGQPSPPLRFDLDDVPFADATRIASMMTHMFPVPLSSTSVLLARENPENRDRLAAKIEETVYLPGLPSDQITELSNVAKNVFDIKQVTVAQNGQALILRGDDDNLRLVNTTFADILDGGDDVMLDVTLYEVDKNFLRNLGANLPTSAGVISVAGAAQSIVSQNQTLLTQLISSGLLPANSSILVEAAALLKAGATSTALTGLLGTFGTLAGVPLAGVFLGSSTTFTAQLTGSEVHTLDAIQMRIGEKQIGTFRVGSRYPITTSQYSSGISSSLASSLQGITVNGQSATGLLNSLASAQVPVFQYEDLGLTLKITPQVQKSGNIVVKLDMKIEALGGGTINNIPILNSRQLTSEVTVAEGETAMLGSEVSTQESRAIQGIPLLNEIPGLAGTEVSVEHDTSELLITVTPHIARRRSNVTATRRVLANLTPEPQ